MTSVLIIAIAAFVGVAALVGGVAMMLRQHPSSRIEDRLDLLTGAATPGNRDGLLKQKSVLTQPLDAAPGILESALNRFGNIGRLLEQADTSLSVAQLGLACALMAAGGAGVGLVMRIHPMFLPVLAGFMATLPVGWILWRRRRRLKAFAVQLPEALEMLSRALRSGQSLGAGFNLAANEMGGPLGKEFQRVFEEQNLGIALDESLDSLTDRVPNLDLRFFVTAVILQRQTGGDLAEILDKIGSLIRERFQIWGQIQALTGEGRLSGIVLLALPVVLFLAVYRLNPDYITVLFVDPMGKKLLAGAIVLQVLGALCIRKIIDIKV
ncbi:MAG: secretion protein [Rhodopirellula sp.]|nr:secretion protein [Rhodopirellula sp.]